MKEEIKKFAIAYIGIYKIKNLYLENEWGGMLALTRDVSAIVELTEKEMWELDEFLRTEITEITEITECNMNEKEIREKAFINIKGRISNAKINWAVGNYNITEIYIREAEGILCFCHEIGAITVDEYKKLNERLQFSNLILEQLTGSEKLSVERKIKLREKKKIVI